MLSNRSNSESRPKQQKNKQRGINLISNTLTVRPNQVCLTGSVQVKNHSKSKSFSMLDKEYLKGIKYRTGVINDSGSTYRQGNQIQWHSVKNAEKQLKTCREARDLLSQEVQMNENMITDRKAGSGASMQIEQIILGSAYFKARQKEVPRLKIELKRA